MSLGEKSTSEVIGATLLSDPLNWILASVCVPIWELRRQAQAVLAALGRPHALPFPPDASP